MESRGSYREPKALHVPSKHRRLARQEGTRVSTFSSETLCPDPLSFAHGIKGSGGENLVGNSPPSAAVLKMARR